MTEDFNKLVELLTPTFLRKSRLLAWLHVMIAGPLQRRFSSFALFRAKVDYEATVTPQVISLEHAVGTQFDCVCEITELDGLPYDFLVSIDRSRDMEAIKEFITAHKLAGKSFVFQLGDVIYEASWLNYVDEDLIELYSAEWIAHVDEEDGINNINVDVLADYVDNDWYVIVNADSPVKSDIYIQVSAYSQPPGEPVTLAGAVSVQLAIGEKRKEVKINIAAGVGIITGTSSSIFPSSDAFYEYKIIER